MFYPKFTCQDYNIMKNPKSLRALLTVQVYIII